MTMRRTILALAVLLAACGGGGDRGGDELPGSPVVEHHRNV